VRYLRNKLGRNPDMIETVRGAGYILRPASSAQTGEEHRPYACA
jgi:hypothetical protein